MIAYVAILAVQIACIVHVIRNGRNQLWIMALFFLPVASAIAYFVLEILPGLQGNRHVRTARASVVAKLDPEREVRAARSALELADTAANRIRLADALAELDRHFDALPLYREALAGQPGADSRTRVKLARSLFETGAADEALGVLDALESAGTAGEADRRTLLRARVLDHLGRKGDALALYADIVTRLPGEEARCRYAALLIEQGDADRARRVLEEVEARMRRLDRHQRAVEADMYRWATEALARLRAGNA